MDYAQQLAADLQIRPAQAEAALRLLDDGASVPFIARYRKDATGALDDVQLRQLSARLDYLRALQQRRESILERLRHQNQLTPTLHTAILNADSKVQLEDLYRPYQQKRHSKAQQARTAGLAPLAEQLRQGDQPALALATAFIRQQALPLSAQQALQGAADILIESIGEQADLLQQLRQWLWQSASVQARAARGKADEHSRFRDYYHYQERLNRIPSHRAMALLRGQRLGELSLSIQPDQADKALRLIGQASAIKTHRNSTGCWRQQTLEAAWKKLHRRLQTELLNRLRDNAEQEAIQVFARNLKNLLLAAPAGGHVTLGLDPGLRHGVKAAVVDGTGKVLAQHTCYPHAPQQQWQQALQQLSRLIDQYQVSLIAIGNGTAARETEQLVRELIQQHPDLHYAMVNEAGASVYSASELASQELAGLDVSLRGAVSIARRLQDPLAELVKIDPAAIGVGQYQHDVDQKVLQQALAAVTEDCVNHVGVDLNSASVALLSHVAGLSPALAHGLVAYRDQYGPFTSRADLLKVPRLGAKTFQQCAAFLRVANGSQPLDNCAVHPESYPLVEKIAASLGCTTRQLLQQGTQLRTLRAESFVDAHSGQHTVQDVLAELQKPGRDPRPTFQQVAFAEHVTQLDQLTPGMQLNGIVTNVTNFGAFVDIGVHQDGLVHISELADHFVRDPHQVVSSADPVRVRVLAVDIPRRRIALSMKKGAPAN